MQRKFAKSSLQRLVCIDVKPTLLAVAAAAVALPTAGAPAESAAAKAPLALRLLSGPPAHPVAGSPWRLVVRVRRGARPYAGPPPVLRGRGDVSLLARTARTRPGVFTAVVRFPTSGPWTLDVRVGGRTFPLGAFRVDVPITQLIRDPFGIAATAGRFADHRAARRPAATCSSGPQRQRVRAARGCHQRLGPAGTAPCSQATHKACIDCGRMELRAAAGTCSASTASLPAMPPETSTRLCTTTVSCASMPPGTCRRSPGPGRKASKATAGPRRSPGSFIRTVSQLERTEPCTSPIRENQRIRRVDRSTGVITTFATLGGSPIAMTAAPGRIDLHGGDGARDDACRRVEVDRFGEHADRARCGQRNCRRSRRHDLRQPVGSEAHLAHRSA